MLPVPLPTSCVSQSQLARAGLFPLFEALRSVFITLVVVVVVVVVGGLKESR